PGSAERPIVGSIEYDFSTIKGSLNISDSTILDSLDVAGTKIEGQLNISDSLLPPTSNLNLLHVGSTASLRRNQHLGPLLIKQSQFGSGLAILGSKLQSVDLSWSNISGPLVLVDSKCGGNDLVPQLWSTGALLMLFEATAGSLEADGIVAIA